jgi:hypothetical protein
MWFAPQAAAQSSSTPSVTLRRVGTAASVPVPAVVVTPAIELTEDMAAAMTAAAPGTATPQDPPAANVGPPAPGAAPTPPDPRIQLVKQTIFDRRRETILAAQSSPEMERLPEAVPEQEVEKLLETMPKPPAKVNRDPNLTGPVVNDVVAHETALAALRTQAKTNAAQQWQQRRAATDVQILARHVTLGRWSEVRRWLLSIDEPQRMDVYEHFVRVLPNTPQDPRQNHLSMSLREENHFTFEDLIGIWECAPKKLERKQVAMFVPIVQRAVSLGHVEQELLVVLRRELATPDAESLIDRRAVAWLLDGLGRDLELGEFLPSLEEATANNDHEALNLLAKAAVAEWRRDKKAAQLERAWSCTQAALAAGEIDKGEKAVALRRAVELAPKVRAEFGDRWLVESFTTRPERGMEILATIGSQAAVGFRENANAVETRQQTLELQKSAVEALLQSAPGLVDGWKSTLVILAENWMREAAHSYDYSTTGSRGPQMRRDSYGNIYWNYYGDYRNSPVQPLEPGKLLDVVPSESWYGLLPASMKPRFAMTVAKLFLKVGEAESAFPYIRELAGTHTDEAKQLAREFMRVWTQNHNPNAANQTNPYMFMYGFDQRANGIPLTRSQQERNLKDLQKWVAEFRALPTEVLDEAMLVDAFTQAHSSAEVYRLEAIEAVFGKFDQQKPETLADLVQRMRANLATVWRKPSTQEEKKTRRKQKDIEREVLRGYADATAILDKAIRERGEHWKLLLAQASVVHDMNNFGQELGGNPQFAASRTAALEAFERAAKLYASKVVDLNQDEESTEAFEVWFYAALGACDLAAVTQETRLAAREPKKIRDAILALPGEAKERHMARFANLLFNRMSAVNAAIKSRYLDAGFEIVGDHPQAEEARKVHAYYKDLVSELKLVARVDGADRIGWKQRFGVHIDLLHTKEIERESGGFGKYLTNQNNQPYAYNYGRPLENYRDKFEQAVREALEEQFEIVSVTFNNADVRSKDTKDYGWRTTPYAYLLLQPKGPEIDKIPQIRFDFDFLDTSGFAVLPVMSAVVPIDAGEEKGPARPFSDLEITQVLDERKADSGKLSLEIKAIARGLVPELDEILELPGGEFRIERVDDQGVSVSSFDDDRERVLSERLWNVVLVARQDLGRPAEEFRFASAKVDEVKMLRHRYLDADLITAEETVKLERKIGDEPFPWGWVFAGLGALAIVFGGWFVSRRGPATVAASRLAVPDQITPFTVLGLLRRIESRNELGESGRAELRSAITRLETFYFAGRNEAEPDLRRIAEEWVSRAG